MTPYKIWTRANRHADRDWMVQAACRDIKIDPNDDIFFPAGRGPGSERKRRRDSKRARQICNSCPVQQDCYEYALILDIRFGIFGGVDEQSRPNGGVA